MFDDLVRRFNEEAGDHFTQREVIKLMVKVDLEASLKLVRTLQDAIEADIEKHGGEIMAILYQTEDSKAQVKLRAEDGSVWLSQAELAE